MVDVLVTDEELVEQIQQGINVQENMGILYSRIIPYIKRMVHPLSKMLLNSAFDMDDLMQESYFAICHAVEKFDLNGDGKFVSFAANFIKYDAIKFVRANISSFAVSEKAAQLSYEYNCIKEQYDSCSDSFYADKLGISVKRFLEIKNLNINFKASSIDSQFEKENGDERSFHEINSLSNSVEEDVLEKMTDELLKGIWDVAEDICTEKEFQVLKKYYIEGKSFNKIGCEIGKCAEIPRKHHLKALEKMRTDNRMINIAEMYFDYTPRCAFHYGVGRFKNTMTSSTEFIAIKHLVKEERRQNHQYWLTEEGLMKVKQWLDLGVPHHQIAQKMHITKGTLFKWRKKHPELSAVFDRKEENNE